MKKIGLKMIILMGFFILLSGCNQLDYTIDVSTPQSFKDKEQLPVKLTVNEGNGEAVSDLNIQGQFEMVDMDHGMVSVDFNQLGKGEYIGLVNLPMGGRWQVVITGENSETEFETMKTFSVDMKKGHETSKGTPIPSFDLLDQDGKAFTNEDLIGKKTVVTFTFTNCAIEYACPAQLANFNTLQKKLAEAKVDTSGIQLISFSVDPEVDTPKVLKDFADKMEFDQSYFKLLTGDLSEIRHVADSLGIFFEKEGAVVNHSTNTLVFDESGKLTHEFETSAVDLEELFTIVSQ